MSIPRAKREYKNHREYVPGPQAYDSSGFYQTKHSGTKIGTSKRRNDTSEDLPGVGQYNLPQLMFKEAPAYRLSGKWNDKYSRKQDNSPSPLSYQPNYESFSVFTKCPKYSIAKSKHQQSDSNLVPGPGHYTPQEPTSPHGIKYQLQYQQRFPESPRQPLETNNGLPGPANYNMEYCSQRLSPKYTFSKKERSFSTAAREYSPGPGRYETSESKPKLKGGVIAKTATDTFVTKSDIPGPGTYNYPFFSERSQGPKFPQSLRERTSRDESPGPQRYDVQTNHRKDPSYSFGHQGKQSWKIRDGPGPGQYESFEVQKHHSKVHMIGKPKDYMMISQDQLQSPSPQNYSPTSAGKVVQVVFPKAERNALYLQQNTKYPGPGEYYRQHKRVYKFAHTYGKRRNMSQNDTPGPGFVEPMVRMTVLKKLFNGA